MPANKIDFYLDSSDSLRSLTRAARRLAELQQVLLDNAPPELTQSCRVKQCRDGTLTLLAENAAIAAKLKQLAARLLTAYQKQRWQITSIRIEVQVRETAQDFAPKPKSRRLSVETIKNLQQLASQIDDVALKQALLRMASRQRDGK
jgi:hypothetical protein